MQKENPFFFSFPSAYKLRRSQSYKKTSEMQKENPFFFSFPMATIFLKTIYDNLDNSYFCMPTSDTSIRRIIGRLTDFITIVVQSCPKLPFLHIIPQKKNSAPL